MKGCSSFQLHVEMHFRWSHELTTAPSHIPHVQPWKLPLLFSPAAVIYWVVDLILNWNIRGSVKDNEKKRGEGKKTVSGGFWRAVEEGECWVRKMGLGSPTNRTKYRDQEQASSMHQAKGRACVAYVGSK